MPLAERSEASTSSTGPDWGGLGCALKRSGLVGLRELVRGGWAGAMRWLVCKFFCGTSGGQWELTSFVVAQLEAAEFGVVENVWVGVVALLLDAAALLLVLCGLADAVHLLALAGAEVLSCWASVRAA